jgi:hypothetical protein
MLGLWSDLGLDIKKDPAPAFQVYSPQLIGKFLQKLGALDDDTVLQYHSLTVPSLLQLDPYKASSIFPLRSNIETLSVFLKLCGSQSKCKEKNAEKFVLGRSSNDFTSRGVLIESTKHQSAQMEAFSQIYNATSSGEAVSPLILKSLGSAADAAVDDSSTEEDTDKASNGSKSASGAAGASSDSPAPKIKKHKKKGSKDSKDGVVRKGSVGSVGSNSGSPKVKSSKK